MGGDMVPMKLERQRQNSFLNKISKRSYIFFEIAKFDETPHMDWIISTAIGTAALGAFKIIKDAIDRKKQKLLVVVVETILICYILFTAIFGQLTRSVNEKKNRQDLDDEIGGIPKQIDTGLSLATDSINSYTKLSKKEIIDSLKYYKSETETQKKVLDLERKPVVDINSIHRSINPSIKETGKDTIQVSVEFENIGNSWAKELHIKTLQFVKYPDQSYHISDRPIGESRVNKMEKMFPGQIYTSTTSIIFDPDVPAESDFYFGALFCYKDSLEKSSGILVKLYKWKKNNLAASPFMTDDSELDIFESKMKERKLWPDKPF